MAAPQKPRYVDVANPSLALDCPRCGLRTARFVDQCRNCGSKLWPSSESASAAFLAWRAADPARATASRFNLDIPGHVDNSVGSSAQGRGLAMPEEPSGDEVAVANAPGIAKSVAPAFWVASGALAIAAGLEVALFRELQILSARDMCGGSGSDVVNPLILAISAVLFVGGIVSLSIVFRRRPSGTPLRDWFIVGAALEMVASLLLLVFNAFLITLAFGCGG